MANQSLLQKFSPAANQSVKPYDPLKSPIYTLPNTSSTMTSTKSGVSVAPTSTYTPPRQSINQMSVDPTLAAKKLAVASAPIVPVKPTVSASLSPANQAIVNQDFNFKQAAAAPVPPPAQPEAPISPASVPNTESQIKTPEYTKPNTTAYDSQINNLLNGPDENQIQREIESANAIIDKKYDMERERLIKDFANRKQESFSQLAGVGFNPLNSGSTNLQSANDEMMNKFLSALENERNTEKAARSESIRGTRSKEAQQKLTNLQSEREYLTAKTNESYERDRQKVSDSYQNMLNALTIQKTKRDLSVAEKNDQFGRIKDMLGTFGSQWVKSLSEADLRALEKSSGLPAGSLNANSKTLAELEKASTADGLKVVAPGSSVWDPLTQSFIGTAPTQPSEAERKAAEQEKTGRARAYETATEAVKVVNEILNNPDLLDEAGFRLPGKAFFNGTDYQDLAGKVTRIKALLTTENLQMMRGLGALSDKEFANLQAIATSLDPNMSQAAFQQELERIQQDLTNTIQKGPPTSGPINQPQGFTREQYIGAGLTPEEADEAVRQDNAGFKSDQSTSQNYSKLASIPDGYKGGQCGSFIYRQTGFRVGDTFKSKMDKMDPSIKIPQPGMVFAMRTSDPAGHIGYILDIQNGIATVKDSNWQGNEKVLTHKIPVSKMAGFNWV